MEPVFFVMAILGCGDTGDACRQIRTLPAHYASVEACSAEAGALLAANTDVDYPEITADCRLDRTVRAAAPVPAVLAMRR